MSSIPPISVLMPVYNAERYVREAVQSILDQTFGDFEFNIVNDGSTDKTLRILKAFAEKDNRINIISRPNTGLVGALTACLQACRGEFVARMDADDVAMPQRFEKQISYMREHPECVALGSRVKGIDPYGCELFISDHKLTHEEIDADLIAGRGWALVHPAVMMRRRTVLAVRGYTREFEFAEDLDLFLRLAERGRVANLPEVLLEYRQHPDSINRTKQDVQAEVIDSLIRDAHVRRGLHVQPGWKYKIRRNAPKDQQLRTWAWKSLKEGNVSIARKHAMEAWKSKPLSIESWRVLLCALRGY